MAFKANKFAIAELFAKAGADVDHIEPLLLGLVSQSADLEPIRQALKMGASIHAQDRFGWTALHAACTYGHKKVVQTLLAAGADPASTTKDGKRPIDFATVNGHRSIAKLLRTEPPRRER
jgi:ankyrin repeat protein